MRSRYTRIIRKHLKTGEQNVHPFLLARIYKYGMGELELLARLIKCEAGGEGDIGMRAVATVVMNRVRQGTGEYGRYNTVNDVVFAPRQFECATNQPQSIYYISPDGIHYDIARRALAGEQLAEVGDALWFFNPYSDYCRPNFPNENGYFLTRIGNHCFYAPTSSYYST